MSEILRIYLAKYAPPVGHTKFIDLHDIYVPFSETFPKLRMRKSGTEYEIAKKVLSGDNLLTEIKIPLSQAEFDELVLVRGKAIIKRRHFIPIEGKIAEVDVFYENLAGLVLINFEFPNELEYATFTPPAFCGSEVTKEEFVTGRFLAGKQYSEVEPFLTRFNYQKISF